MSWQFFSWCRNAPMTSFNLERWILPLADVGFVHLHLVEPLVAELSHAWGTVATSPMSKAAFFPNIIHPMRYRLLFTRNQQRLSSCRFLFLSILDGDSISCANTLTPSFSRANEQPLQRCFVSIVKKCSASAASVQYNSLTVRRFPNFRRQTSSG